MVQIGKSLELKYRDEDMIHELGRTSSQTAKVVNELQEDIMRVRMLPVGTVFSGLPRMIRGLAQKSKKKVDFVMEGQETGIDRTVIEHIRDPLVHLLRNAVDHGIETCKRRSDLGKPDTAMIWLSACHEESHVVITVEDDGGGIDANAIRESAVKKGFMSVEEASKLSDEEAVDLIFGSGFSTKEEATDVSGRGVGLDIVRKNIEALNGYVTVETRVGSGTKFTLRLPLTLATLDSLLITCGEALYAIPVVNVWETVRVTLKDIHRVGGREVIRLRGSVLLLVRLSEFFDLETGEAESESESMNVVVVRAGDKQVGIAVETLVGKQEIVVKSLDDNLGKVAGIAGASILGDGQVALIVDVPGLIESVIQAARN
jgi:two-component system chemotaxis sensor kinase CheA